MAETSQFNLPLLSASQAQKSVTVNEALSILDAVSQLRIVSSSTTTPPNNAVEGDAYMLPIGVGGEWFGEAGRLAISCNAGWRFVTPKVGWHAFNIETGTTQLFDGTEWLDSTLAATQSGTATEYEIVEVDHVLSAGTTSLTVPLIAQNAQVIGVTGRIIEGFTGTLTSWSLGIDDVGDAPQRFGHGLGLDLNSYVVGMSGSPTTYYSETPLLLSAEGGEFSTGVIRLAVHFSTLVPPRAV